MGFDCTFFQKLKKRGPTGNRVSQIREQQQVDHLSPSPQGSSSLEVPYQGAPELTAVPETHWPGHGLPTPAGPGWGVETVGWSERDAGWNEHDVEHWLPAELDTQIPVIGFPETNIYLKPTLPSMAQEPCAIPPSMDLQTGNGATWPAFINEANMIPWINVYFDRLHPTLPVLNRSSLFTRMFFREHRKSPQFGSMLLSLCAFSLTQPIEINERPTASSRATQARLMMHEAIRMRSSSEFGEHPTIEAVLTSFFLFGCLFGSNQHNAAFLRLREALDLAAALGLNDPASYLHLSSEMAGQRLRTYLVLSVTERAYALQRRHPITFWGQPGASMQSAHLVSNVSSATQSLVSGVILDNEKDAEGMLGLARLMDLFDAIDESVLDCWNGRCCASAGHCENLTAPRVLSMQRNIGAVSQPGHHDSGPGVGSPAAAVQPIGLTETQRADVQVTQKWLQNRIWVLCSTHGLLGCQPDQQQPELSPGYAVAIAQSTLGVL
ncbi:C6 transcription factor [Aspergillus sp. HF37]|nr:C6 transcription factor [Aspergillus sp. HF37]